MDTVTEHVESVNMVSSLYQTVENGKLLQFCMPITCNLYTQQVPSGHLGFDHKLYILVSV